MGKELAENHCINALLNGSCTKKTSKYLRDLRAFSLVDDWREAPDFLLKNGDSYIGIEHFVIDLFPLQKEGITRSGSRISCEQQTNIFNENHTNLINDEFDSIKACSQVEQYVQNDFNLVSSFDYRLFVEQFDRVFVKHLAKVEKYKNNISIFSKDVPIFFLIEARLGLTGFEHNCVITRNDFSKIRYSKITEIPITYHIVNILRKCVKKVDGVVVTSYNLNDPLFVLKDMIYIDTKTHENVVKSIEKQGRNLYLSFDIKEIKRSVKLDLKED